MLPAWFSSEVIAQNNAIFYGGPGDGWHVNNYVQASNNNMYFGGSGDGWNANNYSQAANNLMYFGGSGDGWNTNNYSQASNLSLYFGGSGDGWNGNNYVQASNLILFKGGQGDGWANTYSPLGPLPVTLLSFEATKKSTEVLLTWKTSAEINSSHYEIEKSPDAVNFSYLATVVSHNEATGSMYDLIDEHPFAGYNYYRIKMVDLDGKASYTPTRHVLFDNYASMEAIRVYPIPSTGMLYAEIPVLRNLEPMVVNITNSLGQVLLQQKTSTEAQTLQFDLSSFAKGTYYIQLKSKSVQKIEKVILQ